MQNDAELEIVQIKTALVRWVNTIDELWSKTDLAPVELDQIIAYMRQARRAWEQGQKPKKFEDLKVEVIPETIAVKLLPAPPKITRRF